MALSAFVARDFGVHVLFSGAPHTVSSTMGTCKSTAAVMLIAVPSVPYMLSVAGAGCKYLIIFWLVDAHMFV